MGWEVLEGVLESTKVPQALNDHIQEAVVFAVLVEYARSRPCSARILKLAYAGVHQEEGQRRE
jgi:hypothetical protein